MFSSKPYHICAVHAVEVATTGGGKVGREFLWTSELFERIIRVQSNELSVFVFVFVLSSPPGRFWWLSEASSQVQPR